MDAERTRDVSPDLIPNEVLGGWRERECGRSFESHHRTEEVHSNGYHRCHRWRSATSRPGFGRAVRRLRTETKAAFKTTEFWAMIA